MSVPEDTPYFEHTAEGAYDAFLCRKTMQPIDPRYDVPACAVVCVYPNLVRVAKRFLGSSGVKVASIATAFPTTARLRSTW
jgi:deoxyribose-phosphate aldolase